MAVAVALAVCVAVAVAVAVCVAVAVAVGVDEAVAVAVDVADAVAVAVLVAVAVGVAVAIVAVGVAVGVTVAVVAVGVAVGVADEVVPNAVPLRLTVWVVRCALSVKVSFPVSAVPLELLSVVGLKVTDTWQVEFAGTDAPQLLAVIANGPLVAIEEKLTACILELLRVTVFGGDTVPTCTLPNAREVGDTVGVARYPAPDRLIDCVVGVASSVTTAVPVVLPVCVGVKITPKVQVPLAGTSVPLHMSLVMLKTPEVAMLLTLSATLLGLISVTVFAALATSTCWLPKPTPVGEKVGLTRMPVPLRLTICGLL